MRGAGSNPRPYRDIVRHLIRRRFTLGLAKKLVDELIYGEEANDVLLVKYLDRPNRRQERRETPPQPLDPSTARWLESEHRIGLPVAAIGSHFTFYFSV